MLIKAAACLALAATCASAQWEVLYDSRGMEHWEVGEVRSYRDSDVYWGIEAGPGAVAAVVSSATDPTLGDRSLRLDLGPVEDSEVQIRVSKSATSFWAPLGTRGIRYRFDIRRTEAEWMDQVTWEAATGGDWGWKGGFQSPNGLGEGSTTFLMSGDHETPTLTEAWVTVEHTFDLWRKTTFGRYGAFEADDEMGGCCYRGSLSFVRFRTRSPWRGHYDAETIWIDNLVIETVPPCFADCDRNLQLDLFDFLCFQNQFAAGDHQADCNQDGRLTFDDFLCFQDAFAADCDI